MGKQLLSHRYNFLPLLRSRPGGVQKELIVEDLPTANVRTEFISQKLFLPFFIDLSHIFSNVLIVSFLKLKYFYFSFTRRLKQGFISVF
jgi:hypothetical protein